MKKVFSGIGDYIISSDKILWLATISATVYSVLLLTSVERSGGSFVRNQILAAILGTTIAIIISMIDYEYIGRIWWALSIMSIGLFAAVFLFGMTVTGTDDTAWLVLPGGITFQPSELVKICFIVTFGKHLDYLKKTPARSLSILIRDPAGEKILNKEAPFTAGYGIPERGTRW